jgi:hypothetical protein
VNSAVEIDGHPHDRSNDRSGRRPTVTDHTTAHRAGSLRIG